MFLLFNDPINLKLHMSAKRVGLLACFLFLQACGGESHTYTPYEEQSSLVAQISQSDNDSQTSVATETLKSIDYDWPAIQHDMVAGTVQAAKSIFSFSRDSLVDKLSINGIDITRAPIVLEAKIDGTSISLPANDLLKINESASHIRLNTSTDFPTATVETDLHIADDGFLLVTLNVAPKEGQVIELQNLSIEIPFVDLPNYHLTEHASYNFDEQRFDKESLFESITKIENDPIDLSFSPVVSIESSEIGIEWMTETNAWHSLKDPAKAVSISRNENGLDVSVNLVTEQINISKPLSYQFSLFPIPSRDPSRDRNSIFFASSTSAEQFSRIYSGFKDIKPVYFANWSRMPFEHSGLPKLSEEPEYKESVELELDALRSNGLGYMPYTNMHFIASDVPELRDNLRKWRSDDPLRSNWTSLSGDALEIQPIAFTDNDLTEFMLNKHLQAAEQTEIDVFYHDVAAMNRLKYTQQRAVATLNIPEGAFYAPFFGQRDYVRRYRSAIKNSSPLTEIAFHTGASLPKSIATYSDYMIFGEPFHQLFKENANGTEADYVPDYFTIPLDFLEGPNRQKNGFTYVLIPQLIRPSDGISPDQATLDRQTRALLTFAAYFSYPVWGTKLSTSEYLSYQKIQDDLKRHPSPEVIHRFDGGEIQDSEGKLFGVYIYDDANAILMLSNGANREYSVRSAVESLPNIVKNKILQEFDESTQIEIGDSMIINRSEQ